MRYPNEVASSSSKPDSSGSYTLEYVYPNTTLTKALVIPHQFKYAATDELPDSILIPQGVATFNGAAAIARVGEHLEMSAEEGYFVEFKRFLRNPEGTWAWVSGLEGTNSSLPPEEYVLTVLREVEMLEIYSNNGSGHYVWYTYWPTAQFGVEKSMSILIENQ